MFLVKLKCTKWLFRFKNVEVTIEDKPRSGRFSTARTEDNIVKIHNVIGEDRRRTIDQLEGLSRLSFFFL